MSTAAMDTMWRSAFGDASTRPVLYSSEELNEEGWQPLTEPQNFILNLTNLLYKDWGRVYFSSDLFNSTASVGLRPTGATQAGYPVYVWEKPAVPYQTDLSASRWQMQLGLRYNF